MISSHVLGNCACGTSNCPDASLLIAIMLGKDFWYGDGTLYGLTSAFAPPQLCNGVAIEGKSNAALVTPQALFDGGSKQL